MLYKNKNNKHHAVQWFQENENVQSSYHFNKTLINSSIFLNFWEIVISASISMYMYVWRFKTSLCASCSSVNRHGRISRHINLTDTQLQKMINVFKILWYKKNKGAFDKYKPGKSSHLFQRACISGVRPQNQSIDPSVTDVLKSYCTAELKNATWNCVPLSFMNFISIFVVLTLLDSQEVVVNASIFSLVHLSKCQLLRASLFRQFHDLYYIV